MSDEAKTGHLRIGEMAQALGTTSKTLRFYEQVGLLGPPRRSEKGYRLYDQNLMKEARLVLGLRRLGLGIDALKELCSNADQRRSRLLAVMDERIRQMDESIAVLQGRRDDLASRHEALLATPRAQPPRCVCAALFVPCDCH